MQVCEGICREEFSIKSDVANQLIDSNKDKLIHMNTEKVFNQIFNKKGDVNFVANPNMAQFKRRLTNFNDGDKPMLLIHVSEKVFGAIF